MSRQEHAQRMVVGFDGSDSSRAAVDYALERAGSAGQVIVVHAFGPPADWLGQPNYQRVLDEHETRGRALLDALRLDIEGEKGPQVEFELIGEHPAEGLARVAQVRDAAEIVVGSRGFGRLRAAFGSVSHELVHVVDRPVVVIPERFVERAGQASAA